MNKVSRNAQRMAANLRQQSRLVVLAITAIVAALIGGIAQLMAFTNAIWPMVGALAAVPAMAVAAAAGIATLIVGLSGLFAAMKRATGGGGDLAAREHQIAAAQRNAAQAQEDLNDARKRAADLIADTARQLARARLDEEGAILAVSDAQRELREARMSGDRDAIRHASLNYREAVQSLEEVRAHLVDVTEEEGKRRQAGVEGSDEVTAALQRQRDAEYELAQARKGSGGSDAAAQAYAKLTREGKALVDVLHSLAPAWGKVKAAVQSAMLAGVAGDIKMLSTAYLPVMKTHLVDIGKGWNNVFRGSLQFFSRADVVADMDLSLGRMATMWQKVGHAFVPFWSGFRHLVVVGSEFLPRLGDWVLRLANRFDVWAFNARKTGKAHDWIEKALKVGHEFNQLLFALGGATGALFAGAAPDEGYLQRLTAGAASMRDFWRSPEGKAELMDLFSQLRDIWSAAWVALKQLMDLLAQLDLSGFVGLFAVISAILKYFADHADLLNKILPVLIPLMAAYELASFGAAMATKAYGVAIEVAKVATWLFHGAIWAAKGLMMAWRAALWIVAGAQWQLNAAMYANPIGLIILAVIALIAVFVILWLKFSWFRDFWIDAWRTNVNLVKAIAAWFSGPFVDFFVNAWHRIADEFMARLNFIRDKIAWVIGFVLGIRQKVIDTAHGMWDGLVLSFKGAINYLIRLWNDFHLTLGGGTVLGVSIPSVTLDTPNIPYLEAGAVIRRGGAAVVADRNGRGGEVVSLPRGAQVTPLPGGAGGVMTVRIELCGPAEMIRLIRKITSDHGGGNVQVAFGK